MILSGERAVAAYKKVSQVKEAYKLYSLVGDTNRLSIEDFYHVVADMYQVTITKKQVPYKASFLRGMMERNENLVKIRVRLDQEQDWKRFTAVKEICHVIIDEKEDWSVDGVETIKEMTVEYTLHSEEEAKRVTQSETLAEIAAVEMMYPFACRIHDRSLLSAGGTTEAKIAHYYGVPAVVVARSLSEPFHEGLARPLWELVNST